MFESQFAVFLGKESEKGYFGFIAENNFFFILQVDEGLSGEEGRNFLAKLKDELINNKINNLSNFENIIGELIRKKNLPLQINFAGGYLNNDVLYLKTGNEGKIYLHRQNNLGVVIEGNCSASGYIKDKDYFIFTTKKISRFFVDDKEFKSYFDDQSPPRIIDKITPVIKAKEDQGLIILLIKFFKITTNKDMNYEEKNKKNLIIKFDFIKKLKEKIQEEVFKDKLPKRKLLNLTLIILIFFLLLWSVVFGVKRRNELRIKKRINTGSSMIEKRLKEAEDFSFFNLEKSKELLNLAYQELDKLKKETGERKEIFDLKEKIKQTENKIYKKEEKKEEEFFDLAVENEDVKGEKIYLQEDLLFVLDKKNGYVYRLSLTKKSLENFKTDKLKLIDFFCATKDKIFLLVKNEGIYQMEEDKRIKKIINYDSNWQDLVDFNTYNNNLYLLDKGRNEIYKYVPTENGYSDKISYFKGGGESLGAAFSMAIDSSVYVATIDSIFKFTSGQQEDFKINLPVTTLKITKIYTDKNLAKLYLWEKEKGILFILNKNGNYERQIINSILKKANDFVIFKEEAYILLESKIYRISL